MNVPNYEAIIAKGSHSFARAARLLPKPMRADVLRLYAWCRACDDLIDGQEAGHARQVLTQDERRQRLYTLQRLTDAALSGETVDDAPTMALAALVKKHAIDPRLPRDLLQGFAFDVEGTTYYQIDDTLRYCYHVAGVVGLMMAGIMGVRDKDTLDRACDLGLAFQLTNIARDLVEDARHGHVYAPQFWLTELFSLSQQDVATNSKPAQTLALAQDLIRDSAPYYKSAHYGAMRLPFRAAWAIQSARLIYAQIGWNIILADQRLPARASTSTAKKLHLIAIAFFIALYGRLLGRYLPAPPRVGKWCGALWQRS